MKRDPLIASRRLCFFTLTLALTSCTDVIKVLDSPGACLSVTTTATTAVQAKASDAFVDTICVNFRLSSYRNRLPVIKQRLVESGIRTVSDVYLFEPPLLRELADAAGARTVNSIDSSIEDPVAFAKAQGPALAGLQLGLTAWTPDTTDAWAKANRDYLSRASAALRSDPQTRTLAIFGPSLGAEIIPTMAIGDLSPFVDVGAINPWTQEHPGAPALDAWIMRSRINYPQQPLVVGGVGHSLRRVDPSVQARYVVRTFLEHALRNIERTCLSYFIDGPGDGDPLGLLTEDGTPRPAFVAVKNMVQHLSDVGPMFTPAKLAFALQGEQQNLHHLLLARRSGTFSLIVWLEIPSVQEPATREVELILSGRAAKLEVRQPDQGISPTRVATNADRLNVAISDVPTIIDIIPGC